MGNGTKQNNTPPKQTSTPKPPPPPPPSGKNPNIISKGGKGNIKK